MVFTDYWKVLVLNYSEIRNTVFFESKSWWKDDIYWLLKSSRFELFGDGKYGLFFSQKVDSKMIFTWSFWVLHDILGFGKYGFSWSESFCAYIYIYLAKIFKICIIFTLYFTSFWLINACFSFLQVFRKSYIFICTIFSPFDLTISATVGI